MIDPGSSNKLNNVDSTLYSQDLASIVFWIYLVISVLMVVRLIWQLCKLILLLKGSQGKFWDGAKVIETNEVPTSFSFFHWVILSNRNELEPKEKDQIIKHELAHVQRYHTWDLLAVNLLQCLFWCNPIIWVYRTELEKVHEYEADFDSTTPDTLQPYCALLAKVALTDSGFPSTNHFNRTLITKRIAMLNTAKKEINYWKWHTAAFCGILFFLIISCQDRIDGSSALDEAGSGIAKMPIIVKSRLDQLKTDYPSAEYIVIQLTEEGQRTLQKIQQREDKTVRLEFIALGAKRSDDTYAIVELTSKASQVNNSNDEVLTTVDEPATPPFGMESYYRQIAQLLQYPERAKLAGKEGRVVIEFVVGTDGVLSQFKALKGFDEDCDAEALRVMMLSQRWHPARHKGVLVNQRFYLPISFKLPS